MKFQIDAKSLSAAIASVSRVVEARNTIPILSNIVLHAHQDGVLLRSTDLDLEYSMRVAAEVSEPGTTTIPARLASDIVKKMTWEVTVSLTEGAQEATISAGRSRFKLMTLPVEDYPSLDAGTLTHTFALTGDTLHRLFSRCEFAISTEETRYYLNGIYMHETGGKLRSVATDGHRLAKNETDAPEGSYGMPGIIVPRKTVKEAIALGAAAKGEEVRVEVSATKVRFTHGSTVLTSKIIDGTFPDYERVMPQGNNIIAYVDSKALALAADRVSTISTERGRAVKLTFENGGLSLVANSPDAGSAEDVIDVDFDADPLSIGYNAKYVSAVLANLGEGKTRIALADPGSPTLFSNENEPGLQVVLMPLRV